MNQPRIFGKAVIGLKFAIKSIYFEYKNIQKFNFQVHPRKLRGLKTDVKIRFFKVCSCF